MGVVWLKWVAMMGRGTKKVEIHSFSGKSFVGDSRWRWCENNRTARRNMHYLLTKCWKFAEKGIILRDTRVFDRNEVTKLIQSSTAPRSVLTTEGNVTLDGAARSLGVSRVHQLIPGAIQLQSLCLKSRKLLGCFCAIRTRFDCHNRGR